MIIICDFIIFVVCAIDWKDVVNYRVKFSSFEQKVIKETMESSKNL